MNKLITLILITFLWMLTIESFAQKKKDEIPVITPPEMPVDKATQKISYTKIVELHNTSKELYDKGLKWMNEYYKNPTDVIKQKEEGVKISGKARFRLQDEDPLTGKKTPAGVVMYEIILQFKEGKARVEITNISWQQPSYYGIEKWVEENKKQYNRNFALYLVQSDEEFKKIMQEFDTAMKKTTTSTGNDW